MPIGFGNRNDVSFFPLEWLGIRAAVLHADMAADHGRVAGTSQPLNRGDKDVWWFTSSLLELQSVRVRMGKIGGDRWLYTGLGYPMRQVTQVLLLCCNGGNTPPRRHRARSIARLNTGPYHEADRVDLLRFGWKGCGRIHFGTQKEGLTVILLTIILCIYLSVPCALLRHLSEMFLCSPETESDSKLPTFISREWWCVLGRRVQFKCYLNSCLPRDSKLEFCALWFLFQCLALYVLKLPLLNQNQNNETLCNVNTSQITRARMFLSDIFCHLFIFHNKKLCSVANRRYVQ